MSIRFEAPLFFANADCFPARVQALVKSAPHPVKGLVLDLVSMNDIDYIATLLSQTLMHLEQQSVSNVSLCPAEMISWVHSLRAVLFYSAGNSKRGSERLLLTPRCNRC